MQNNLNSYVARSTNRESNLFCNEIRLLQVAKSCSRNIYLEGRFNGGFFALRGSDLNYHKNATNYLFGKSSLVVPLNVIAGNISHLF